MEVAPSCPISTHQQTHCTDPKVWLWPQMAMWWWPTLATTASRSIATSNNGEHLGELKRLETLLHGYLPVTINGWRVDRLKQGRFKVKWKKLLNHPKMNLWSTGQVKWSRRSRILLLDIVCLTLKISQQKQSSNLMCQPTRNITLASHELWRATGKRKSWICADEEGRRFHTKETQLSWLTWWGCLHLEAF